jgi:thioredoxin 1
MSDSLVKHFDDAGFKKILDESETPVFVDFWAPWCGPCRSLAPIIDKIAPEYNDRLLIGKMNVDENQDTPAEYGIRGIPAMLIFKDGEVVGTKVGLVSEKELKVFIEEHIRGKDEHAKSEEEGH